MKRSKAERTEATIEFVLEIVLTLVGLGVGVVVYNLLGIDVGEHTDYEWLSLVGIIVIFMVLGGIGAIVNLIAKMRKKKDKDGEESREEDQN